jgi:hypothetical protein
LRPQKGDREYLRLFRLIDGALIDCIQKHPDYFPLKNRTNMRNSIVKRIAGQIRWNSPRKRGVAEGAGASPPTALG